MKRKVCEPRQDWQRKVYNIGLTFHTDPTGPYWDESTYYEFTQEEIQNVEQATSELYQMLLKAVDRVVTDRELLVMFCGANEVLCGYVEDSWKNSDPSFIYGRFDFSFQDGTPKLLEFNADTPHAWLRPLLLSGSGFKTNLEGIQQKSVINLIFYTKISLRDGKKWPHKHEEDFRTINYLLDLAVQAGIDASSLFVSDIGWNKDKQCFVDLQEEPITRLFKLYPWEWLTKEEFSGQLLQLKDSLKIIEPAWKMILSNKNILPVLWEMFPNHPNLLPSYFEKDMDKLEGSYVLRTLTQLHQMSNKFLCNDLA